MQDKSNRPTLLMVGSGDPMDAALKVALDRHGLFVETVGVDGALSSVHLTAPDLVLLVGDAAKLGGVATLTLLNEDPSTASVPVALLAPDTRMESRMGAFRHGAMAVVPRGVSADAIARRVAHLSRELSEHFEEKTGELGEADYDGLVAIVKKERRSGILSVHTPGHKGGAVRIVLGAGRPVAEAVQELEGRLRPHIKPAERMYYQFHMSAGGAVELLDMAALSEGDTSMLKDLRVLLVDDEPQRADNLAGELRDVGAVVFVTDSAGHGLERAVGLDPQVAIVDEAGLEGQGFEVVRAIRRDKRLRWASILVAPWKEIWPEGANAPDLSRLSSRIQPLLAPERDLRERASKDESFDVRLESMGPSRIMRVLTRIGKTTHITVRNPKAVVEVDIAENLIVGALAQITNGAKTAGAKALATLMMLGSGRVHVEHRENPSVLNIMVPIEEALAQAAAEPPGVIPSIPPAKKRKKPQFAVPKPGGASGEPLNVSASTKTPSSKPTVPAPELKRTISPPASSPFAQPKKESGDKPTMPAISLTEERAKEVDDEITNAGSLASTANEIDGMRLIPKPLGPGESEIPDEDSGEIEGLSTRIRDLSSLAAAGEALLDDESPPATSPTVEPEPEPRVRSRRRRVGTMVMGSGEDDPTETEISTAVENSVAMAQTQPAPAMENAVDPKLPPTATAPGDILGSPVSDGPIGMLASDPTPSASLPPPQPNGGFAQATTGQPAGMPPPAPASDAPVAATQAMQTPEAKPSGGGARTFAKLSVLLAALVLLVVLALVGYKYSGAHIAPIDSLLATLGVPVAEDPVAEDPVAEDPVAEDPIAEDPIADEPVADEPVADEPVADEPVADEPVTDDPATDDPVADEPVADDPVTDDPVADDPDTPRDPNDLEGLSAQELVVRARRAGNSELGIALYRRALLVDNQSHRAMVGLGRLLMERGEHAESVELLRTAVRRRRRRASYHVYLADALAAAGDSAAARAAYEAALELEPENARARQVLGQ